MYYDKMQCKNVVLALLAPIKIWCTTLGLCFDIQCYDGYFIFSMNYCILIIFGSLRKNSIDGKCFDPLQKFGIKSSSKKKPYQVSFIWLCFQVSGGLPVRGVYLQVICQCVQNQQTVDSTCITGTHRERERGGGRIWKRVSSYLYIFLCFCVCQRVNYFQLNVNTSSI